MIHRKSAKYLSLRTKNAVRFRRCLYVFKHRHMTVERHYAFYLVPCRYTTVRFPTSCTTHILYGGRTTVKEPRAVFFQPPCLIQFIPREPVAPNNFRVIKFPSEIWVVDTVAVTIIARDGTKSLHVKFRAIFLNS